MALSCKNTIRADYYIGFKRFNFQFDVQNELLLGGWRSPIFTDSQTNYRWVAELTASEECHTGGRQYRCKQVRLILHDSPSKNRDDLCVKCMFHAIRDTDRMVFLVQFSDILRSASNSIGPALCNRAFSMENEVRVSVTVDVEISDDVPKTTQRRSTQTCWSFAATVPRMNELSGNMLSLLNSGKYSDVIIEAGDASIAAHKNILAARSPVFASMFEQDMREARDGRVQLREFDAETVKDFIQFLYTDRRPDFTYESAIELLRAADMYEVVDLEGLCDEYLCTRCSESNCVDMLVLADRYGASRLKKRAVYFACANPDVMTSEQIATLPNSLMVEIMLELASKTNGSKSRSSSEK